MTIGTDERSTRQVGSTPPYPAGVDARTDGGAAEFRNVRSGLLAANTTLAPGTDATSAFQGSLVGARGGNDPVNGGGQATGSGEVNRAAPVTLANNFVEALIPDAIVVGETHGPALIGNWAKGGNFALFSTRDGSATYFGARPIRPLPDIPTPFGPARGAVSVVGTANANTDQAGVGISYKVPTPIGDVLLFVNSRQDTATLGSLAEVLSGRAGDGRHTVNVNLGVAYSASDGALRAAAGTIPGAVAFQATADALGADLWVGGAYQASATFEVRNGVPTLTNVNISGVNIPFNQLGSALGQQLRRTQQGGG